MSKEKVYTTTEVAKIAKVTRQTVLNWIRTGEIKAIKLKREWRITQSEIDRVMKGK